MSIVHKLWGKNVTNLFSLRLLFVLYRISILQYKNKTCSESLIHSLWGISNTPYCFCDLQMKYSQVPRGAHYLSLMVTNSFGLSSPSVVTNGFLKIFKTTEVPESSAEIFAVTRNPYACSCWRQLIFAIKRKKKKNHTKKPIS